MRASATINLEEGLSVETTMSLERLGSLAAVILGLSAFSQAAEGQNIEPQSVVKRYIDAQNADDL